MIYPDEEKRILSRSTCEGLVFTTINLIALTKRLLDGGYVKYVCLGTFTQDVLEATFGNLVSAVIHIFVYQYLYLTKEMENSKRN